MSFRALQVITEVAIQGDEAPPDSRSMLIGYLLGQRASEDPRLLRDEKHLRAWAHVILRRLPENLYE